MDNTTFPRTAGRRLRSLREEEKLTQEQLAEKIGQLQDSKRTLSSVQIGYLENDRREMSLKYAELFAHFFNVNSEWLLYGRGFKSESEANAAEKKERSEYVHSVLNKRQIIKQLMSASLLVKGYILDELPKDIGSDIDTHIYQLTDRNGQTIIHQDDGLYNRIQHYIDLEMTAFLYSALSKGKENNDKNG